MSSDDIGPNVNDLVHNKRRPKPLQQHEAEQVVRQRLRGPGGSNGVTVKVKGTEYMLEHYCTHCGMNHLITKCGVASPKLKSDIEQALARGDYEEAGVLSSQENNKVVDYQAADILSRRGNIKAEAYQEAGILNRHGNIKTAVVDEIAKAVVAKLKLNNAGNAAPARQVAPPPAARPVPLNYDIRLPNFRNAIRGAIRGGAPRGGFRGAFQPQPPGHRAYQSPQRPAQQLPGQHLRARGGFRAHAHGLSRAYSDPETVRTHRSASKSGVDWDNILGANRSETDIGHSGANSAPEMASSDSESMIAGGGQNSGQNSDDGSEDLISFD